MTFIITRKTKNHTRLHSNHIDKSSQHHLWLWPWQILRSKSGTTHWDPISGYFNQLKINAVPSHLVLQIHPLNRKQVLLESNLKIVQSIYFKRLKYQLIRPTLEIYFVQSQSSRGSGLGKLQSTVQHEQHAPAFDRWDQPNHSDRKVGIGLRLVWVGARVSNPPSPQVPTI